MSDIIEQIKSEEYRKKLLQAWIASKIAYNGELVSTQNTKEKELQLNKIKEKYSNFNHGIEEILSSKDYSKNSEFRNNEIMSKHIICKCSNSRLIIALSIIKPKNENQNLIVDFFKSIEYFIPLMESTIEEPIEINYINKCIYNQGCLIPIGHLVEKLKDEYELVFTGFSFGAALAAVLAIRLLTDTKDLKNDELNRISFIGFGCPLFVNEVFQTFIDKQHKDKFHFYRHENDFNVNFFDLNTAILKLENVKPDMNFILDQSKSNVSYHPFELNEEHWRSFSDYLIKVKECVKDYLSEKKAKLKQKPYIPFGHNLVIKLADNTDELIEQEYTSMKIHQNNIYIFIEELTNQNNLSPTTSIDKYFSDAGFPQSSQPKKQNINYFYDFDINKQSEYLTYKVFIKDINTGINKIYFTVNIISSNEMYLGICKSTINNLRTLLFSSLITYKNVEGRIEVEKEEIYCTSYQKNRKNIWYKFPLTKELLIDQRLEFKIFSMYDEILLKLPMNELIKININIDSVDKFHNKDKIECINEMPLDSLYIHALVFVYLVNKSDEDEKNGQISENCKTIIENLNKLDQVLMQSILINDDTINKFVRSFNLHIIQQYGYGINEDIIIKNYTNYSFSYAQQDEYLQKYLSKFLPKVFYLKLAHANLLNNTNDKLQINSPFLIKVDELELEPIVGFYKINKDIDLKYETDLNEIIKELNLYARDSSYLGFYEKIIQENQTKFENIKQNFQKSVVYNFNIREALNNSCLVGVIGLDKAAKSLFFKLILGREPKEIDEISAYKLNKDLILVDYPYLNDKFNKMQFKYSILLIDYFFLVCNAEQFDDVELMQVIQELNGIHINRFCMIINMDKIFIELDKNDEKFIKTEIKKNLKAKKKLIIDILEPKYSNSTVFRKKLKNIKLIPVCLNENISESLQEKLRNIGIFFKKEKFEKEILLRIFNKVKNEKIIEKISKDYVRPKKKIVENMSEIKSDRKLLQSLIACELAEKNDLNGDYAKYGIEKAVYSEVQSKLDLVKLGIKKLFSKHVICQSSEENKKRLIIAVTITNQEDSKSNIFTDFFGSFESTSESTVYDCPAFKHINKCIVHHGSIIPIGHLIDKLNENYELVFTGYCFGAALAAFLAIRVLTDQSLESKPNKLNNVSFIGFGCPSFVKTEFKKFIEDKYKDKFEFYRHENDFYANFFDLNSHILVDNNRDLKNDIAEKSYSFYRSVSNQAILDYLSKIQSYSVSNQPSQKYFVQFGTLRNFEENINKMSLMSKIKHIAERKEQITKIEGYFEYFESFLNQFLIDNEKSQNVKKLDRIDDFDLLKSGNGNSDEWKFHQYYPEFHNEYECTEYFSYEFPKEKASHYTVVVIELPQEINVLLGVWKSSKNWKTYFCATMSSSTNSSNVVLSNRINVGDHVDWLSFSCSNGFTSDSKFKFEIFSFYNKDSVSLEASGMLNIIVQNEQEKDNDKAISVYQLAVDLLFVNALIFVYVVEKMTLREENEKKTIKDDLFKEDSDHLIDTFHKMQRDLKREKIFNDRKKENDAFFGMYKHYEIDSDLLKKVDWKSNIPFREQFKKALEKPTLKEYIFELLPVIYFLKQAQVSSFENAQPLWTDLTSSYLKYDCQEGLMVFRKAMWYFKTTIEDDLKYDRACKETTEQLYKIEMEEKSSDIQNILPYKGFYEKSVKRIYDEKQKEMKRINYEKYNLKEEFLRSMVWNFEIRKTLCDNCLIGVTGLKKAGKSSFVKLFTGKDIASSVYETTEMSAYRISDKLNLLLIDYPHNNSTDRFYELQFAKSKFMLDYVFVVIDAIQFGDSMTVDLANMLGNVIALGVRRFCIIVSRFDILIEYSMRSFDDMNDMNDIVEFNNQKTKFLHEKKNLIVSKLEEFDRKKHFQTNREELKKNLTIFPTCLILNESSNPGIQYKYQRAGVLYGEKLKRKLLKTIADNIKNQDVITKLESLYKKEKITVKKCTFITKLKNKYKTVEIDIDKENYKFEDIIDIIKPLFRGIDVSFCIKPELSDSNSKPITSIDEFFDNDGLVFIVEKNNEKECAFVIEENPELKPLEVTINRECKFNELQQKIKEHFSHIKCSFWIKPKISPLDSESTITSTDGFFNSTGFTYIIEIYK